MRGRRSHLTWMEGATWVFQGTIAETADAGTHVCTLTVTPGAGNEMEVLYGSIIVGNTATAQTPIVFVLDVGGNQIARLAAAGYTTAFGNMSFPNASSGVPTTNQYVSGASLSLIISGTMQLVLQVTTAAVSVTQTFAVACRILGNVPTAVLNDTVGAFVATTNTNRVF